MLQFLKYVLATIVGIMFFVFFGFVILAGVASMSGESKTESASIKENSVMKLNLNTEILETVGEDENMLNFITKEENKAGLIQIKRAIKRATAEKNIKGIYLLSENPSCNYATLEEIREELMAFQKTGKFIYAYGSFYSGKGYYVASVADKLFLNPAGMLAFQGLSTEITYLKGAFDKLEIKPVVFKVGAYKSAVEPFLRDDMSDENKEQLSSLNQSVNNFLMQKIAISRKTTSQALMLVADSLSGVKPSSALKNKLITDIGYLDEFENTIKKALKSSEKNINYISNNALDNEEVTAESKNKIAVIVSEGEIVGEKAEKGTIGSDDFTRAIRKAKDDNDVKAIVLRINSPGGSSLASEIMWREIQLAKKVKPVIASMGDYAASGGYYMAMGADKIVAEPTTITGSIGIFGLFFNFESFMKNKLGISTQVVKTNTHADFPSATKELTESEKIWFQQMIEDGYESFTTKAALGRKMNLEKLKTLAGGRVWTGLQAKENGLVDVLGGLNDAIKIAASSAKLKENEFAVTYLPKPKSWLENLTQSSIEDIEESMLKSKMGVLYPIFKETNRLQNLKGIQARIPFSLTFK
ncbi:MAG: signal peptide peptidase SppA [Pseudarcicella sp.]|nr:signal peptide peptidase SppA [Pseudarcicella sp.]